MRGSSQHIVLPDSMAVIVSAIGISASLSLVQIFAGAQVWVPKSDAMDDDNEIAQWLGLPLAKKLAQAVGGQLVSVPQCQRMLLDQRDAEIRRRSAKETNAKLAQDYGLTERTVRLILARQRVVDGV